jgi:hypothetical protein
MKQTAVEWLVEQLGDSWENVSIGRINISIKVEDYLKLIEQAKEMEEEQIIDARQDGFNRCFRKGDRKEVANEQYYNETFKSK